jgi:hypothetical protein
LIGSTIQPSKGALEDPTFWQRFETVDVVRAFYDWKLYPSMACDLRHMPDELSRLVPICPEQFEPSKCHGQDVEEQLRAVPVLDIRYGCLQGEDIAKGVYQ